MKRRFFVYVSSSMLLSVAPVLADPPKTTFLDYDDDLMHDLDRTIKFFEPDVSAQNEEGAADDAAVLRQGFQYTETYFSKLATGADAVKISRDGLALLDAVSKNIAAKNFEAATESARNVAEVCKACHLIYKPKQARG